MSRLQPRVLRRLRARSERGYVAVTVAIMLTVLLGFCAFAVDVGNWYYVGQKAQKAADAAALAGVPYLPSDQASAFSTARLQSKKNEFENVGVTTVTPSIDGRPTRLRVKVTTTVKNQFGWLLGVPTTTIARSAVADYAGPVPMGSPCNEYGDDPYPSGNRSSNCNNTGAFWANVGSPQAPKGNGDAFQNSMGSNSDYDANGYFYSITLDQDMPSLTIEAFDPALIAVGDKCDVNNLAGADNLSYSLGQTVVSDPDVRYAPNATSPMCTGDVRFGGTGEVQTQFTMRGLSQNAWDPLSYPVMTSASCAAKTFAGYDGDMAKVLKKNSPEYNARPDVAANFRQWKPLCTMTGGVSKGTYLVQIKTNGLGSDAASGHNRFSLRAYGSSGGDKDHISISGYAKMAMYGNTPNGTSKFYLAKVPTGSRGQLFTVRLFDIGDGATAGSTVKVMPPQEYGNTFSGCQGSGVQNGALTDCTINVSSAFNGQWQDVTVPIPSGYTCQDTSPTGCWLRLEFYYGPGSGPADTTSWTANVAGDPVRLVE
ncbi:Flp pilus assembly protein TadG [Pedococcus dokdonensis]|uniref:Flp pilus assembly protein TadG n=1 Tax=Pedococcus dokdonensis TaxID=443156 RepID=A0A1H0RBV8_9MICO|nr:pilus assembly protein TadG-related protein [Pedococcus dokdonensis]SDP26418.1 Flp pilus assembly protein TadG [Pedococcus dokdonensis]